MQEKLWVSPDKDVDFIFWQLYVFGAVNVLLFVFASHRLFVLFRHCRSDKQHGVIAKKLFNCLMLGFLICRLTWTALLIVDKGDFNANAFRHECFACLAGLLVCSCYATTMLFWADFVHAVRWGREGVIFSKFRVVIVVGFSFVTAVVLGLIIAGFFISKSHAELYSE